MGPGSTTTSTRSSEAIRGSCRAHQRLESELLELKQRLAWFERTVFGRKSERFVPDEEVEGQLRMAFGAEP